MATKIFEVAVTYSYRVTNETTIHIEIEAGKTIAADDVIWALEAFGDVATWERLEDPQIERWTVGRELT